MSQRKCAVITGITGQDGSYLAELLLEKGYHVVGLLRRSTNYHHRNIVHLTGKIDLEYGDLIDPHSIERLITKYQPDEVYNLAAQSVPADSWSQPVVTAEITALGPVRFMEAIRLLSPKTRYYQATTREIYGGIDEEVIDESKPVRANNPYGAAKLYAHLMVDTYRQSYDMFTCSGILFNHESPRRGFEFVTRKITSHVARIKLGMMDHVAIGNLDSKRDWGHSREYVRAMWMMLQCDRPDDYVIATGTSRSVRDLVRLAFSHVGLEWEEWVRVDPNLLRPAEVDHLVGDASKARQNINWSPTVDFEHLVGRMVDADMERVTR